MDAILINIFEFCIRVKAKLHEMMQTDKDFIPEDEYKLNPCQQISIANSLKFIQNPVKCCIHMHYLIQEVNKIIENQRLENTCKGKIFCFHIIIVSFLSGHMPYDKIHSFHPIIFQNCTTRNHGSCLLVVGLNLKEIF